MRSRRPSSRMPIPYSGRRSPWSATAAPEIGSRGDHEKGAAVKWSSSGVAVIAVLSGVGPAVAADPAALVEDVSGASAGVEFMDYLAVGREIRLGAQDRLVLD